MEIHPFSKKTEMLSVQEVYWEVTLTSGAGNSGQPLVKE